jgi:hypothetical protein
MADSVKVGAVKQIDQKLKIDETGIVIAILGGGIGI